MFAVWKVPNSELWEKFNGGEEKYNTIEEAQKSLDECLESQGYVFLDQETFDKFLVLL